MALASVRSSRFDHNADVPRLLSARKRFAAEIIGGPRSGKTTALGGVAAMAAGMWGVGVERFAILAPTEAGARLLRRAVADEAFGPGFPLAEVFERGLALSGAVADVAYEHSAQPQRVTSGIRRAAVQAYCARIRASAGIAPGDPAGARFMRARLRQVGAAIGYLGHVRLADRDLIEAYAEGLERGIELPNPTQWLDLAQYWDEWKLRERAVEPADILTGRLYPDADCPLVLLDDADEAGPLARAAAERLFPRAAIVISACAPGCLGRLMAGTFTLR